MPDGTNVGDIKDDIAKVIFLKFIFLNVNC